MKFFLTNFLINLRILASNNYWCIHISEFFTETLHFSGCWLFLKKWDNEIVVTNITTSILSWASHRDLFLHKSKKKNCLHKILANFQIKSHIIMRGESRNHANVSWLLQVGMVRHAWTCKKWWRIVSQLYLKNELSYEVNF